MHKYGLLFIVFFISIAGYSQVLDDSTKQIYSNKTVEYFYENDVLRNIKRSFHPDSTLTDYHYGNPVRKSSWLYQDLGNVGTASQSILFEKDLEIGQQMGMDVFKLYAPTVSGLKYYNTRSPYTYLGYQQGGGHTQANITHSQNIHSRLNLTLNVIMFNSEKQYGYLRSQEVLVNHWRYDVTSNYTSENNKYKLLAGFYHFNHKHGEQGGVKNGLDISQKDIEPNYSRNYDAALSGDVSNRERWNNLHVYQQFLMKNSLQTFHILDFERKYYSFSDPTFADSLKAQVYRIATQASIDTLAYSYRFNTLSNKFGVKGIYKGFNYQAYGRHRIYKLNNEFFKSYSTPWQNEFYVGGLAGYVFPDSTNTLDLKAEFSPVLGTYLFDATLFYKGFEVGFYNASRPAGLFYQRFDNGLFNFSNRNLKDINSRNLSVKFPISYKSFMFVPQAQWTSISNHVYLKDVNQVQQAESGINLLNLNLDVRYFSKNFSTRYQFIFNSSNNESVYPIPKHIQFANFEFNFLYAKVLRIYTGFDFYFKSKYTPNNYSPLTTQFIAVQNQEVGGVPVLDWYIKFPLSKGRIALNWNYINKRLFGNNGFYTTPTYLNQGGSLMIKVDWPLFD